jgi:hypothetical protein
MIYGTIGSPTCFLCTWFSIQVLHLRKGQTVLISLHFPMELITICSALHWYKYPNHLKHNLILIQLVNNFKTAFPPQKKKFPEIVMKSFDIPIDIFYYKNFLLLKVDFIWFRITWVGKTLWYTTVLWRWDEYFDSFFNCRNFVKSIFCRKLQKASIIDV